MGLFAKAAAKATKETTKVKKKATTWNVGDPEQDEVSKSVKELVRLSGEAKALTAKMSLHKQTVHKFANRQFVTQFADNGVLPETPMKVVNADGDSVTFVVQDRSGQYSIKDEQVDVMVQLLGEDATNDIVYEENTIRFDRLVMSIEGVAEAVEKALESAVRKLIKDGVLTEENADELIVVDSKRSLRPGTLERAAMVTGKDVIRLGAFLDAAGSQFCRYVKP